MNVQQRIEEECAALARLLATKNAAYGDAASSPPILMPNLTPATALFVRMSDKVARIRSLVTGADANDESLEDTIRDLAGYCILYLATNENRRNLNYDENGADGAENSAGNTGSYRPVPVGESILRG